MRNISFDNPYLLLAILPLLAAVVIPFCIAIRRDNRSKSAVASLALHLAIVLLVGTAAAGLQHVTTVTKTEVVVVADVSYSTKERLDTVDAYVANVQASLPKNSQMGLVCFAKDQALLTPLGGELVSVSTAQVDDSATDLASAVRYASTLFGQDAVKRIVLITDGMDTDEEGISEMIGAVEELYAKNIRIDAMYLDSNLSDSSRETQISGVTYDEKIYLNHEATADVLVQSTHEEPAILRLTRDGQTLKSTAVVLQKGFNVFNLPIPTNEAGSFSYEILLEGEQDTAPMNNHYSFVQDVASDVRVLFVSQSKADLDAALALYGERAQVDAYMDVPRADRKEIEKYENVTLLKELPLTAEELCVYDEYMLSTVDVRDIDNVSYFIELIGGMVSEFGKSLVTVGDISIQNKTDDTLKQLEEMLPVRFGNTDQAPKLYGIVIDCSRSMFTASRLQVAKDAATYLVNMLNDGDYVAVIQFAGESFVIQTPVDATNRESIAKKIHEQVQPLQGTFIGGGLQKTYQEFLEGDLASMYSEKQIMLISDGLTFTAETADAGEVAAEMYAQGIVTSVINPYCKEQDGIDLLKEVAAKGGGSYYELESEKDLEDVVFSQIADDVNESIVERETAVHIEHTKDEVLKGVSSLPNIHGFLQSRAKTGSTVPITVRYVNSKDAETVVPLYAYRDYGNGRVTSLCTSFSGEWVKEWTGEGAERFWQNLLTVNTPEERIDYPYRLNITDQGGHLNVEILPLVINPEATATVLLTLPDGETVTEELTFDSTRYFYSFRTDAIGTYEIRVRYAYTDYGRADKENPTGAVSYESVNYYCRPYAPEYDRFALFSPANLNASIRHRGTVREDGAVDLTPDEDSVVTYTVRFTVPFLIAAAALFVADVIVRKIKMADLRGLFAKRKKTGGS